MFGACAEPTIWSRSVFSMTIVSTLVTGTGLAAGDPQPVGPTAAARGAAPAEPAKQASNIAIAQTVVFMECPIPEPTPVRISLAQVAALPWSGPPTSAAPLPAEVSMHRFIIATA